jgi:hypothetical protein
MSVNLAGIGPGRKPGHNVELAEEAADNAFGIAGGAQTVELGHHLEQGLLDILDRALGIILALPIEALLAFEELLPIEIRNAMQNRIAGGTRICQEA